MCDPLGSIVFASYILLGATDRYPPLERHSFGTFTAADHQGTSQNHLHSSRVYEGAGERTTIDLNDRTESMNQQLSYNRHPVASSANEETGYAYSQPYALTHPYLGDEQAADASSHRSLEGAHQNQANVAWELSSHSGGNRHHHSRTIPHQQLRAQATYVGNFPAQIQHPRQSPTQFQQELNRPGWTQSRSPVHGTITASPSPPSYSGSIPSRTPGQAGSVTNLHTPNHRIGQPIDTQSSYHQPTPQVGHPQWLDPRGSYSPLIGENHPSIPRPAILPQHHRVPSTGSVPLQPPMIDAHPAGAGTATSPSDYPTRRAFPRGGLVTTLQSSTPQEIQYGVIQHTSEGTHPLPMESDSRFYRQTQYATSLTTLNSPLPRIRTDLEYPMGENSGVTADAGSSGGSSPHLSHSYGTPLGDMPHSALSQSQSYGGYSQPASPEDLAQPSARSASSLRDMSHTRGGGRPPPGVPKCASCGMTNSPEWRKGESGKKDLCNA